jgi:two-component system response regulator FixJ
MNDVERCVVLIGRETSIVDRVAAVARPQGLPLRHFESVETWLAEADTMALPVDGYVPPAWVGCLVCQADLAAPELPADLARVCHLRKGLPVIVLTESASVAGTVAAMQAGATAVLEHPANEQQLGETIRTALTDAIDSRQRLSRATLAKSRLAELNDGENAVLEGLLEGLANKEIAHKLEIGLRTVELRRSRITKKMHARSLAELVRLVCEARGTVVL